MHVIVEGLHLLDAHPAAINVVRSQHVVGDVVTAVATPAGNAPSATAS